MTKVRFTLALAVASMLFGCGQPRTPLAPSNAAPSTTPARFGLLSTPTPTTPDGGDAGRLAQCLAGVPTSTCFTVANVFASRALLGPESVRAAIDRAATAVPNPPVNVQAYVYNGRLTLYWTPPTTGPTPTDYFIEAGSTSGGTDIAAFFAGSASNYFYASLSSGGTYYVRVRAAAAGALSAASNEVVFTIADPRLPGAPYGFRMSVIGSTVTLTWFKPSSGADPVSYVIQAADRAGGPPTLANFATGGTATTYTATGVAPGTYFVRILAANSAGVGPASEEVPLIVAAPAPCTAPPLAASNLVSLVNGSSVILGWSLSASGTVTSYVVEAGSAPTLADLAVADTGSAAGSALFTGVSPGRYYVRVRGKNACGTGAASNEIALVVQ